MAPLAWAGDTKCRFHTICVGWGGAPYSFKTYILSVLVVHLTICVFLRTGRASRALLGGADGGRWGPLAARPHADAGGPPEVSDILHCDSQSSQPGLHPRANRRHCSAACNRRLHRRRVGSEHEEAQHPKTDTTETARCAETPPCAFSPRALCKSSFDVAFFFVMVMLLLKLLLPPRPPQLPSHPL